ncbi:MAG: YCF48-related protein [Bacteroidota bacterium]|jgi:photosystem II stability/assembly factor-like uncharacterized protein
MKFKKGTILCIASLCLFLSLRGSSIAQPEWKWQNPIPAGNTLGAVAFKATTGAAVGQAGTILHSLDTGATWAVQASGTNLTLYGINFVDANTVIAVGDSGVILRSSDGGSTWSTIASGTTNALKSVSFGSSTVGVAAGGGGTILQTTDGGATWSVTHSTGDALYGIFMANATTGFAVGGWKNLYGSAGDILKTTDGGATWAKLTVSSLTVPLYAAYFKDANSGFVVGYYGKVMKTTDGGTNWATISAFSSDDLHAVSFWDANNGCTSGNEGIFLTTDGGSSWSKKSKVTSTGISFPTSSVGISVGNTGTILRCTNSGVTWTDIAHRGPNELLTSVYSFDNDTAVAVGYGGGIFRTTNSGSSWKQIYTGKTIPLMTVSFLNSSVGFAAGAWGTIAKTTDGGLSWAYTLFVTGDFIYAVHLIDANTAVTLGADGIYRTTDGGTNWSKVSGVSTQSVYFFDANNGVAIAGSKKVLKTTNGGATWDSLSRVAHNLNSVAFGSSLVGAIAAENEIARTTDGGTTWTASVVDLQKNFMSVFFSNANNATIVGFAGIIYRTTDGGATWVQQTSPTHNDLYSVYFTDVNNGTIVGDGGTILRTTNGGVTWVTDQRTAPNLYTLSQNYPNPFNPTTTIRFSVDKREQATVIVYDILGREVARLFDGIAQPGHDYQVIVSSQMLSSGVYFYRMVTSSRSEVKRMVLMK